MDHLWLVLAVGAGLVVMFLFAFTLPGLVGEGVAALALLALIVEGMIAVSRRILGPRFP